MTISSRLFLKAACFAIASLGATALVATVAMPDTAYAKGGNGGGNGGGKGGGKSDHAGGKKGGYGKAKGASGKSAKAKPQHKHSKPVTTTSLETDGMLGAPLHPSEKGKWNASNANQAALDAHIRNQKFNGTIGALAQYQLASKAAAGEELSEAEQAALDSFVGNEAVEISDQELEDLLNGEAVEGDPVFSVEDGVVDCTANCDGVDLAAAQDLADAEAAAIQDEAEQAALDDFLSESEARIVNESNKQLSPERTEDLLDELASDLGVTRPAPEEDVIEEEVVEEEVVEEALTDETLIVTDGMQ